MTQLLTKIIADFSTTLTNKTAIGATTATLTSGLDGDAIQLSTGTYGFTIDRNNSNKEYFTATLNGANLTSIKTVTRGTGVGTSGLVRTHRKGAEVIISDWVAMKRMLDILDGTTSLDASTPLSYDGVVTLTPASNELATVAYVVGVSIAGAADATATTKGITKMSVAPVSASSPIAVGDNDTRLPTQNENDALVGTGTPSSSDKFVNESYRVFSPVGVISPYSGSTAPTGWLIADGSAVSRTTYAALFAITSTTYGVGDGSTTFNLPDLKGRVPVGKSADTEFDTLGETGGEKTHALTEAELASHGHTLSVLTGSGAGSYGGMTTVGYNAAFNASTFPVVPKTGGNNYGIDATGSGTAHNNLQPYITINYIIKY